MAHARINGLRIRYELTGAAGAPLVFVHGSWSSHRTWDRVVPALAASFRVLTFDRRGHSESEDSDGQGSVRQDVADVAGLIEHLDLAPAWVAGSSFGASIVLRLAAERPDLLRGAIAHEPPLFGIIADDPALKPAVTGVLEKVRAVVRRIETGDHAGGAEQFIETVALGPGGWNRLPPSLRQTLIENARTYVDEGHDPEQVTFDLDWIRGFSRPTLLTQGDQSPPMFAAVVARLAQALPKVERHTFAGAGHIPYNTHPEAYGEVVTGFLRRHGE